MAERISPDGRRLEDERRKRRRSAPRTKVARRRVACGLEQTEVSHLSGVSLGTLRRLEQGRIPNPGIRYLLALARVLDCRLADLIEPQWYTVG